MCIKATYMCNIVIAGLTRCSRWCFLNDNCSFTMWKVWRALAMISELGFLSYLPFYSSDRFSVCNFQINEHTLCIWCCPVGKLWVVGKTPGLHQQLHLERLVGICVVVTRHSSSVRFICIPLDLCCQLWAADTMFSWQLTDTKVFLICHFPHELFGICILVSV